MSRLKKKRYFTFILLTSLFLILLVGCNNIKNQEKNEQETPTKTPSSSISKQAFKLNTIVSVTIYDSQDESILDGALAVCDQYEDIYSRTLTNSELYQLNNRQLPKVGDDTFEVSEELAKLLSRGYYYSELSDGAFDITIAPVTTLWDFTSLEAFIPDKDMIEKAVNNVGYENLVLEGNKVTLNQSKMSIDLGAIAKGYIADRIKDYLLEQGVKSAMINLGGNVLCVGEKPGGIPFKVGIQKPFADRNEVVATMDITDLSVVSSGIYERYFEVEGTIYHHILNPKTGYPYESNLISITIISEDSVDGDGLSTTCFALGLEKGLELISSLDNVYAIFITDDYKIHYSEGFFDHINVTEIE
jgi:thiamine biosynthesis lipoprotein